MKHLQLVVNTESRSSATVDVQYGQIIRWTNPDGSKQELEVWGRSREEANRKAREQALAFGYTQPKWWQWWRKGDTKELPR